LRNGATAEPAATIPVPDAPVHLRVLNGSGATGLARDLGRSLAAAGLVVGGVGNADGAVPASLLVNRRLDQAAAARLAARLGGLPVVREWDGRCSEDAVLVLGEDWTRVREALAGPAVRP
ncbi:MAG TPA: LytR C-terminal domain-containing protein, partial [Candidatus Krumholzibacteria bacterium]|nr:LytR C-terminal domain-containing protein [Candidatus Krumholzibacteria bacterium]